MKRYLFFVFVAVVVAQTAETATPNPLPELGRSPLIKGGITDGIRQVLALDFGRIEKNARLKKGQGKELREKLRAGEYKVRLVKAVLKDGRPIAQYPVMLGAGYKASENRAPTWDAPQTAIEVQLADGSFFHFLFACGNAASFLPPPEEESPPPPVAPAPPPAKPKTPAQARAVLKACRLGLEKDTGAYAGIIFSEKGRYTLYWGASAIVYGPRQEIGSGGATIQPGIRVSYGGWDGSPGQSIPTLKNGQFSGHSKAVQGGGRYINGTDSFQAYAGYDWREDEFSARQPDGKTKSQQSAERISLFGSADVRTPSLGAVRRLEIYLQGNKEVSREAQATFNGKKVDNPKGFNTSNVAGGVDATLLEKKKFDAGLGLHGSHDFSPDQTTALELRAWGARKDRAIKPYLGGGYAWSKPGDSWFGNAGLSSDLDPVFDWIWDGLTGAGKKAPKAPPSAVEPAAATAPEPPLNPVEAPAAPVAPEAAP